MTNLNFHDLLLDNLTPLPVPELQKLVDQAKLSLQTPINQKQQAKSIYIIALTSLVPAAILSIEMLVLYCYFCKRNPNCKCAPHCFKNSSHDKRVNSDVVGGVDETELAAIHPLLGKAVASLQDSKPEPDKCPVPAPPPLPAQQAFAVTQN